MLRIFSSILVVVALVAMTVPAWSQTVAVPTVPAMTRADSLVAIDRLAKEIAVANPEYPDPLRVPIGVFIRVPNPGGMDAFYRTEPWEFREKGCFWDIANNHLFHRAVLPDTTTAVAPVAPAQAGMDLIAIPWWLAFALALLALGVIMAIILYYRRQRRHEEERTHQEAEARERQAEEERRMDYRNDPPVVAGGLSEDPVQALNQIRAADALYHRDEPGRQVTSARHGTLRSTDGRQRVALRVEHTGPNGLATSDRWVNNGDRCTEVTVSINGGEPVTEYWLRHCGNRFGEIRDGRFQMPEGWEFVPTSPAVTVPAAEQNTAVEAETAAEQVEELATQASRRNGRPKAARDDRFRARVVITNNGGTNPTTRQIVEVTADRYVTEVALPNGATVHF